MVIPLIKVKVKFLLLNTCCFAFANLVMLKFVDVLTDIMLPRISCLFCFKVHRYFFSALEVMGIGSCPLHGHHHTWNNSNGFPQSPCAPMLWTNFHQPMHIHGYPAMPPHMRNTGAHLMDQHHLGSAPSNVGGFANVHSFHPGSLENVGFSGSPQLYPSDLSVLAPARENYRETMFSPINAGFPSLQQMYHATNGRSPMMRVSTSYDATNDRIRSRRHDGNAAQSENKKQFDLDLDRIANGEDSRTTLMIKNIPNKYVYTLCQFFVPYYLYHVGLLSSWTYYPQHYQQVQL
jgi:hypothetical protein